jgi:glycerophosphoryl diester phosphodiesterase
MRPSIISHRGLCRAAPRARRSGENTIAAFQDGIAALADLGFPPAIEFDVRQAADREVVVIHDAGLRRALGLRGWVRRSTSADLAELGVPRLADVLRRFPRAQCHIEVKERGIAGRVLEAVRSAGCLDSAVVSSFLWAEVVPLARSVRIALTTAFPTRRAVRAASDAGAWAIHPEQRKTGKALVEAAHQAGLKVNAWTVNTPRAYSRMARLGVDAVFSDNPRFLVAR